MFPVCPDLRLGARFLIALNSFVRVSVMSGLFLSSALAAPIQTPETTGTGTIAGRVTVGGKPARGVKVTAWKTRQDQPRGEVPPALSVKTDEDGRFRITGLTSGQYRVAPAAPALAPVDEANAQASGKVLAVDEGQ